MLIYSFAFSLPFLSMSSCLSSFPLLTPQTSQFFQLIGYITQLELQLPPLSPFPTALTVFLSPSPCPISLPREARCNQVNNYKCGELHKGRYFCQQFIHFVRRVAAIGCDCLTGSPQSFSIPWGSGDRGLQRKACLTRSLAACCISNVKKFKYFLTKPQQKQMPHFLCNSNSRNCLGVEWRRGSRGGGGIQRGIWRRVSHMRATWRC